MFSDVLACFRSFQVVLVCFLDFTRCFWFFRLIRSFEVVQVVQLV